MRTLLKEVDGIDWGSGAVMNCEWRGPRLRDILNRAEIEIDGEKQGHVAFACYQTEVQEDSWYGGSIELWRAMSEDRDVILALQMNGKPLTREHAAPVRVIVPGVAGARSVKWLDTITVQSEESSNYYQQHDYKILPAEATDKEKAEKYCKSVPALLDMPVNSVIGSPESKDSVRLSADGTLEVKGYALPYGADGPVVKVELSADDGKTWQQAQLLDDGAARGQWCWVLWRADLEGLEPGSGRRILSRAIDKGGNVQEEDPAWNLRGVGYNGYGESRELTICKA